MHLSNFNIIKFAFIGIFSYVHRHQLLIAHGGVRIAAVVIQIYIRNASVLNTTCF